MPGSGTAEGPADPRARVAAAMAAVPREHFLPPDQRRFAGVDRALPIGHDVTNSQPSTVRAMLELLDPRPGHRVLDVGCGSGWTTALLAHLTAPGGHVTGVEILPEVLALGARHLAALGPSPGVDLHEARPGVLGWPEGAPYDRVLVSADAEHVPLSLVEQLTPDGTFVGPVRGRMLRIRRQPGAEPLVDEHGRYVFVPLVS